MNFLNRSESTYLASSNPEGILAVRAPPKSSTCLNVVVMACGILPVTPTAFLADLVSHSIYMRGGLFYRQIKVVFNRMSKRSSHDVSNTAGNGLGSVRQSLF